jgi:alkylated DNA nucleotide flippase Atl1
VPRNREQAARVVTIGVYGFTVESFLDALAAASVAVLLDVRQRRGVRGPDYAWANSQRLQAALADADIAYEHHRELAPTTALRQQQYAEDARQGVGKRSRKELAPAYTAGYLREILDPLDLDPLVASLPTTGAAALLCVERDPEACHRSLVADRLAREYGIAVEHVRPGPPGPPHAAPWPADHEPTVFQAAVVEAAAALGPGELVTYGELAEEIGRPGAAQAVANVLRRAPRLPWWRVIPTDGRLYRTHAPVQGPLLEAEGHRIDADRRVHPAEH